MFPCSRESGIESRGRLTGASSGAFAAAGIFRLRDIGKLLLPLTREVECSVSLSKSLMTAIEAWFLPRFVWVSDDSQSLPKAKGRWSGVAPETNTEPSSRMEYLSFSVLEIFGKLSSLLTTRETAVLLAKGASPSRKARRFVGTQRSVVEPGGTPGRAGSDASESRSSHTNAIAMVRIESSHR